FSSRRRHTRCLSEWSSDVCSSDLRTSLRAIVQLQHATRLAAQRDVQLAELRRDLDRALEIGKPGRFTDQVVGAWQLGNVLGRGRSEERRVGKEGRWRGAREE